MPGNPLPGPSSAASPTHPDNAAADLIPAAATVDATATATATGAGGGGGGGGGHPHPGAPNGQRGAARPRDGAVLTLADYCLAMVAGLTVALITDLHYLLSQPYWLDEAWVADSLRAPLALVPRLSSSTPVAWTLLLRLVPAGGPQRARLVPLAFYGLSVATGYLLGRELRLTRFATGLLTAAAVLLSPALLSRGDLKQYTAEAFAALLVWLLVARLENGWSRPRLAALALVASVGCLLASTVILTGCAALGCLGLESLSRRQWRRLAELAVATAGTLAIFAVIYLLVMKPGINSALASYWRPNYLPGNESSPLSFLQVELGNLAPYLAFVHGGTYRAALAALLALGGMVALALLGRLALAALLPVTVIVVIVASAAAIYPFGDLRTSTFWLVMVPVVMAIGIAAGIAWLAGQLAPAGRLPGWPGWLAALLATAVVLTGWVQANKDWIGHPALAINRKNPYAQVRYVEAHWRPGDVILVNEEASYAFAYYYKTPPSSYPAVTVAANGFMPRYAGTPPIVVAAGRDEASIAAAVRHAEQLIGGEPAAGRGRVWLITDHVAVGEARFWQQALAGTSVTRISMGRLNGSKQEPLQLVRPLLDQPGPPPLLKSVTDPWQSMLSARPQEQLPI